MLGSLAGAALLLTVLDHWSTYLCLRSAVPGWQVSEANPLAAWLFTTVGLVPGLLLDTFVTLGAVIFVVRTDLLPGEVKGVCLGLLLGSTGLAVANNLSALSALGLWPLGAA